MRLVINTIHRQYPHVLGHAVFGLSGLSLVMSDIAFLRIVAVAANALALADVALDKNLRPIKFKSAHTSRWSKRWNMLFIAIHAVWLYWIAHERFAWLSDDEELLYLAVFSQSFTRPQFRTLLRNGTMHTASEETAIIVEATHPDIFLILSSDEAYILAKGRTIRFGGVATFDDDSKKDAAERAAAAEQLAGGRPGVKPVVVGEASYLSRRVASASVVVEPGCRYVRWRREDLHCLGESEITAGVHRCVEVWLGLALAEKLRETTAVFVAHEDELELARSELQCLRYEATVRHYVFEASSPQAREVGGAAHEVKDLAALLEALQAHRRSMNIDDAVHVEAMKKLGLPATVVSSASAGGCKQMSLDELQLALLARPRVAEAPPSLDAAAAKRAAAKRLFDTIDTDGSGSITRAELAAHFQARQRSDGLLLEHVFTEMDLDGEGSISEAEWCATIDTWMRGIGAKLPVAIQS